MYVTVSVQLVCGLMLEALLYVVLAAQFEVVGNSRQQGTAMQQLKAPLKNDKDAAILRNTNTKDGQQHFAACQHTTHVMMAPSRFTHHTKLGIIFELTCVCFLF